MSSEIKKYTDALAEELEKEGGCYVVMRFTDEHQREIFLSVLGDMQEEWDRRIAVEKHLADSNTGGVH